MAFTAGCIAVLILVITLDTYAELLDLEKEISKSVQKEINGLAFKVQDVAVLKTPIHQTQVYDPPYRTSALETHYRGWSGPDRRRPEY